MHSYLVFETSLLLLLTKTKKYDKIYSEYEIIVFGILLLELFELE